MGIRAAIVLRRMDRVRSLGLYMENILKSGLYIYTVSYTQSTASLLYIHYSTPSAQNHAKRKCREANSYKINIRPI